MSFADIIGQESAVAILRRAIRHQRLHHAYLFSGNEGVGKKFTALTLAKALNCKELPDDACDRCPSCHKIDEGLHPDVRVIAPDGQFIKIDQIRDLQKDVGYKPYEGRRKVYILDNAEALRDEAANALLKTLEEPSADAMLVLVTANVYALLPTVISRCQLVRFVAVGVPALAELLMHKQGLPAEQARLIASLSGGCVGRAFALNTAELLQKRGQLEQVLAKLAAGLRDVRTIFDLAGALTDQKAEIQVILDILLAWYRDMYILSEQGDAALVANSDAIDRLAQAAQHLSPAHIRQLFEIVYQTKIDIQHNANLQLALEVMLMSLTEVYNDRIRGRKVPANR